MSIANSNVASTKTTSRYHKGMTLSLDPKNDEVHFNRYNSKSEFYQVFTSMKSMSNLNRASYFAYHHNQNINLQSISKF